MVRLQMVLETKEEARELHCSVHVRSSLMLIHTAYGFRQLSLSLFFFLLPDHPKVLWLPRMLAFACCNDDWTTSDPVRLRWCKLDWWCLSVHSSFWFAIERDHYASSSESSRLQHWHDWCVTPRHIHVISVVVLPHYDCKQSRYIRVILLTRVTC